MNLGMTPPSQQQIQAWFAANPNATDVDIANAMQQFGVGTAQVAQATGLDNRAVQYRQAMATGNTDLAKATAPQQAQAAAPAQAAQPNGPTRYSDQDVQGWFDANPGATDKGIAGAMQQFGVGTNQVGRVTGVGAENASTRYNAAIGKPYYSGAAPTPGAGGSGPTAGQQATFKTMMDRGDFQGAAKFGRELGYSDNDISQYVNDGNFQDVGGKISGQNAMDFLTTNQAPNSSTANPMGKSQFQQNNLGMGTPTLNPYQKNPYLGQMAQGITDQMTDNFNRNIAPGLRSGAVAAGGFGGSRQGVVESNALNDLNRGIGQNLTSLYGQDYQQSQGRNLQQFGMEQNYNLGMSGNNLGYANNANQGRSIDNQYDLGLRSNALQSDSLDANIYNSNFGNQLASANFGLNAYNTMNGQTQQGIGNATNVQNAPMNYNQYFANQYQTAGGLGGNTSQTMPGDRVGGALAGATLADSIYKNF